MSKPQQKGMMIWKLVNWQNVHVCILYNILHFVVGFVCVTSMTQQCYCFVSNLNPQCSWFLYQLTDVSSWVWLRLPQSIVHQTPYTELSQTWETTHVMDLKIAYDVICFGPTCRYMYIDKARMDVCVYTLTGDGAICVMLSARDDL